MTKQEAMLRIKGYLEDLLPIDAHDEVEEIMTALKAQPCEDCVSREAVLDALHVEGRPTKRFDYVIDVKRDIMTLPPVTSKQRTGDFTRQELENWLYSICLNNVCTDFCKDIEEIISRLDGFERYVEDMRCGAKMGKEN